MRASQTQWSPLELGCVRHCAGTATRTTHGDEDILFLLLVEIGAVEHLPGLLLEQLMQRQRALRDWVLGPGIGLRRRGFGGLPF